MIGKRLPNATKNFETNLVRGSLIRNSNVDLQCSPSLVKKAYDLDDGETLARTEVITLSPLM